MELERLEFNNMVEDNSWETNKKKLKVQSKETNILALTTQLLEKMNWDQDNNNFEQSNKHTNRDETGK